MQSSYSLVHAGIHMFQLPVPAFYPSEAVPTPRSHDRDGNRPPETVLGLSRGPPCVTVRQGCQLSLHLSTCLLEPQPHSDSLCPATLHNSH